MMRATWKTNTKRQRLAFLQIGAIEQTNENRFVTETDGGEV